MQLKEKEIIDNLIFAISMDSRENFKNANIQVGSYSPGYIKEGEQLKLIKTTSKTSWAVQGKDFKIGDKTSEGLPSFLSETRNIFFEPSSPFIYMPGADFVKFAREL